MIEISRDRLAYSSNVFCYLANTSFVICDSARRDSPRDIIRAERVITKFNIKMVERKASDETTWAEVLVPLTEYAFVAWI